MDFDFTPLVWLFWFLLTAAILGITGFATLGALILAGVL